MTSIQSAIASPIAHDSSRTNQTADSSINADLYQPSQVRSVLSCPSECHFQPQDLPEELFLLSGLHQSEGIERNPSSRLQSFSVPVEPITVWSRLDFRDGIMKMMGPVNASTESECQTSAVYPKVICSKTFLVYRSLLFEFSLQSPWTSDTLSIP
jgi:hypothetical protein